MRAFRIAALLALGLAACKGGPPRPAELDTSGAEACAFCRMVISDRHLAAQLAARGEEPRFFDDLGCLRAFLAGHPLPKGAVAYVADHRTGEWVKASAAVYAKADAVETPMGSHLLAYADAASRKADPAAAAATPLAPEQVFGAPAPEGTR